MDARIDPEIAAALARLPEAELGVEAMRRSHEEDAGIVSGRGAAVARAEEIEIPGPAGVIPARLYVPHTASARPPLVVYLHGGGWVVGTRDSYDPVVRSLADAAGAAVLSVEYRLAPEDPYPAAIKDAWAALRFAEEQGAALGADPARLAVAGDSAGGGLAAALTRRAREAGGPRIAFQLLVYPAIDPRMGTASYERYATGFGLEADAMEWYWEQYLGEDGERDDPDAAPALTESLGALPPALVVLAELDPLHDEGADYAARLREAGVATEVLDVPGTVHGFWRFLGVSLKSRETMAEAGRALAAGLAPS